MKRKYFLVVIILLTLIFLVSYSFAQDRKNEVLPKIGDTIGRLDKATGWTKSPEGQWVNRQNRIPAYLSLNNEILLDYEKWGTGIDNFDFIELRSINIEGQEYYILIKPTRIGFYKYENIREGWTPRVKYAYFVFQKDEINKITIEKNTAKLIEIDLKLSYDEISHPPCSELSENEMKQKISYNIKKWISGKSISKTKLLLNLFYYDKDDVVRFLIFSVYRGNSFSSYGSLAMAVVPNGEESLSQPDVFDKFYFECPLDNFKKLIPSLVVQ